jgi:hypothetical protein
MSKYLSTGTATWTASTRTISNAAMTPVFDLADQTYGRQIFFRIGANIYYGTIQKKVSDSSVILYSMGSLPTSNGTIDAILLFEYPGAHSYNDYKQRVIAMVKDTMVKLTVDDGGDLDKIIAHCIALYSKHRPHVVKLKIAGNGTQVYPLAATFGSLWSIDYSTIRSVEYPIAVIPQEIVDQKEYEIYDDGTAVDGSNLVLRFLEDTPAVTEFFIVEFTVQRVLPRTGVQNFPDNDQHFTAITTLTAAHACAALAAAFAQSVDKTIQVDSVNYQDKPRMYMELSRGYYRDYRLMVFGTSDDTADVPAAAVEKEIEILGSTQGGFLFHGHGRG